MNPVKLNKQYKKAISDYIKAFEKMHDVEVERVDDSNFMFGDIAITFTELKYSVDKQIKLDFNLNYFDYCLGYYDLNPVNFPNYCTMRTEFIYKAGLGFKEHNFIIELLTNRIKSLLG